MPFLLSSLLSASELCVCGFLRSSLGELGLLCGGGAVAGRAGRCGAGGEPPGLTPPSLPLLQVFIELNHIKKCNTVRGVFVLEEFGNYTILLLGLDSHGSNSNLGAPEEGLRDREKSHLCREVRRLRSVREEKGTCDEQGEGGAKKSETVAARERVPEEQVALDGVRLQRCSHGGSVSWRHLPLASWCSESSGAEPMGSFQALLYSCCLLSSS